MQRGRLLIILGVILGLATLGAVIFLVVGSGLLAGGPGNETPTPPPAPPSGEPTEVPTTNVIVALQPIPRGAEFVEGSIGFRPWPSASVPPEAIQDPIETIGMVAKTEIVQGQIIVRSMLVPKAGAGEASLRIPAGKVAVVYPIDRLSSVAYAIQPDDYVDILITGHFVDIDEEFQTILPNKMRFFFPQYDATTGEPTGFTMSDTSDQGRFETAGDFSAIVYPRQAQIPRRVAQLTVQAAKVVRVGPWIEPPPPPPPGEGTPAPTPTPNVPDIVTIAVTPQDALVLLWLRQSGIYSEMALRAANEENADHLTEAVTLQYMLTRFNISVPPKIEFIMASVTDLKSLEVVVEQQIATPTPAPPSQ